MTHSELLQMQTRIERASRVKKRLEEAERCLQALQGSLALEQYEVVGERLIADAPCAEVSAWSFYTPKQELTFRTDAQMPPEVVALLVRAARIVVRQLREEYAAL